MDNPFEDASVKGSGTMGGMPPPPTKPTWMEDVTVDQEPLQSQYPPQYPPQYAPPAPAAAPPSDNLVVYMRLVNAAVTVLVSAMAVLKLLGFPTPRKAIMALYIWFFAVLLCCFETHLKIVSKVIAQNFGFLYHVKGRCAFLILMAFLCFSLGSLLGTLSFAALLGVAAFNAYVICKHPEYEETQQLADLEQRGPPDAYLASTDNYLSTAAGSSSAFSWAVENPQMAANVATTTATFAQDNPQLVQSAWNTTNDYNNTYTSPPLV